MFDRNLSRYSETLRALLDVAVSLEFLGNGGGIEGNVIDMAVSGPGFRECIERLIYKHKQFNESKKPIPAFSPLSRELDNTNNAYVAAHYFGILTEVNFE